MHRNETILGLFRERVRVGGHRTALRERRLGRWVGTTWSAWSERSRAVAAALVESGLAPGERVVVLAGTRQAWVEVDLGVMMAGGITVPIYPTLSAEQAAHVVRDSGARVAFCDDPAQAGKLVSTGVATALRRIVLFDRRSVRGAVDDDEHRALELDDVAAASPSPVEAYEALVARGEATGKAVREAVEARAAACAPHDVATIMYTSGTSGPPRGAVLTHANLVTEVGALATLIQLGPDDEQVLHLPLAHVFGRVLEVAQLEVGFVTAFAQDPRTVMADVLEINPTFFCSVPLLFERIRDEARRRAASEGELRRRFASWALDVGERVSALKQRRQPVPALLAAQHRQADRALSKVRGALGGRLRFALSGGAPLSAELAAWFHAHGVLLLEGYGLTETSSATHLNTEQRFRFGTVGWPVPGVEVKLAGDGEILVRGPTVMRGYFGQAEGDAAAIDGEGFFHTGDVGELLLDGSLKITDRKKDLLVTSGGKNVAPQNLEAMLRASPLIAQAVVHGDGRRHLVALLTLDEVAAARWARERGLPTAVEQLAREAAMRQALQREVDAVNRRGAGFEAIRRFAVLERELSVENDELTPTLKLRRRVIYERHRALFESLHEAL